MLYITYINLNSFYNEVCFERYRYYNLIYYYQNYMIYDTYAIVSLCIKQ